MKAHNVVALSLGLFAAALLWQYYLWPKYQIKSENPEVMATLDETAQKELEESIDYSEPGEILFIGEDGEENWDNLKNAPTVEEEIVFHSQANKPKDLLDIINQDETKRRNPINLERENFVMTPSSISSEPVAEQEDESESRITMLQLPAEFSVIKDEATYKKFLQENKGPYPKVNFKKDMLAVIISSSQASDSFFKIEKVEETDTEIKVLYKVNLVFSGKEEIFENYTVIKNTDLPVKFIQVK